jgi:hypothetical protein
VHYRSYQFSRSSEETCVLPSRATEWPPEARRAMIGFVMASARRVVQASWPGTEVLRCREKDLMAGRLNDDVQRMQELRTHRFLSRFPRPIGHLGFASAVSLPPLSQTSVQELVPFAYACCSST